MMTRHTMTLSDLNTSMSRYVESGEIPGLVYLIQHGDNVACGALGQQTIGGPAMETSSIFRISSMTKPITAVAVMTLVDDGKILLDDSVERFIPELANRHVLRRNDGALDEIEPARRPITIRDLMTYQAGLGIVLRPPGSTPIQQAVDELELGQGPPTPAVPPEPDEWIRRLGELPLIHHPGERWMYGTSADVLGVLIARVSGQPLERYLHERIFDPLEMADTGFHVPPDKQDRFVTSYESDTASDQLTVYDSNRSGQWNRLPAFPSGAAGLVSTASDYLNFARMMLNRGRFGHQQIISEASADLITTNHLADQSGDDVQIILGPGKGWGFGVEITLTPEQNTGAPGSYGWNGGMGTLWLNDPQERLIAILLTQVLWNSPEAPAVTKDFLRGAYRHASE